MLERAKASQRVVANNAEEYKGKVITHTAQPATGHRKSYTKSGGS